MRTNRLVPTLSIVGATSIACGSSGQLPMQETADAAPQEGGTGSSAGADGGANAYDAGASESDAGTCTTSVTPSAGVVVTDRGPVQGTQEMGAWAYRGVPYAAPPLGSLRWAPTEAHACWSSTLAASTFGGICPQVESSNPPNVVGQEDCLTANVWTPSSATPTSKLPILVFIHGGGNTQGSSAEMKDGAYVYDGALLAASENAVVVTFNYRLGPLGFLAHPSFGPHPGNYGTQDQIFALGWVQRNAAAFGGDPTHVLVFGQSAGAVDVCSLVASPQAKGLFSAALMESGGCTAKTASVAQSFGQGWATKAGCSSAPDVASCLRALTGPAVIEVEPEQADVAAPGQGDYEPNVDGVTLTGLPDQVIRSGMHNHVPLVIGSNSDETSESLAGTYPKGMTEAEYQAAVLAFTSNNQTLTSQILAMYPASNYATPLQAYVQVTTDEKFTSGASYDACVAAQGQTDAPVWRYFYSHHVENAMAAVKALGAWHGQELLFVFRNLGNYTPSAGEQTLAGTVGAYWSSMARSGSIASPTWPTYDPATGPYLQIDDTVQAGTGLRASLVQFWNGALGRTCP